MPQASAAIRPKLFRGEDCGATLFKEWEAYRDGPFEYKKGDTWDRLVHQGIHLLQRDERVRVQDPRTNLQIKVQRSLPGESEFLAYLDAITEVDGKRCLIEKAIETAALMLGTDKARGY